MLKKITITTFICSLPLLAVCNSINSSSEISNQVESSIEIPKLSKEDVNFLGSIFNGKNISEPEFNRLKLIAEKGHPKAMQAIAHKYMCGLGVKKDYNKALQWCLKMHEIGYEFGAYALGLMHKRGHGVPKNYKRSYEWFSKVSKPSAELMWSTLNIAGLYDEGDQFLPKDKTKYELYIQKARDLANGGNDELHFHYQYTLGWALKHGQRGAIQDETEGVTWLQKSAKNGHPVAKMVLDKIK